MHACTLLLVGDWLTVSSSFGRAGPLHARRPGQRQGGGLRLLELRLAARRAQRHDWRGEGSALERREALTHTAPMHTLPLSLCVSVPPSLSPSLCRMPGGHRRPQCHPEDIHCRALEHSAVTMGWLTVSCCSLAHLLGRLAMIDLLIVCLIVCLVDWLVARLLGWLFNLLVGRVVG